MHQNLHLCPHLRQLRLRSPPGKKSVPHGMVDPAVTMPAEVNRVAMVALTGAHVLTGDHRALKVQRKAVAKAGVATAAVVVVVAAASAVTGQNVATARVSVLTFKPTAWKPMQVPKPTSTHNQATRLKQVAQSNARSAPAAMVNAASVVAARNVVNVAPVAHAPRKTPPPARNKPARPWLTPPHRNLRQKLMS